MADNDSHVWCVVDGGIDTVCRTCMKYSDNGKSFRSIFSLNCQQARDQDSSLTISHMIQECTSVQAKEDDGYPTRICDECVLKLNDAYLFKQNCLQVQRRLSSMLAREDSQDDDQHSAGSLPFLNVIKNELFDNRSMKLEEYLYSDYSDNERASTEQEPEHEQEGNKLIECKVCNRKISKKHEHLHERHHTKEQPYICTVCNKAFSFNQNLKRHMKTHTGDRPYKCTMCSKSFIQQVTLAAHMRVHTGERPYKCMVCGKSFKQSKHCSLHLKTHSRNSGGVSSSAPPSVRRRSRRCNSSQVDTTTTKTTTDYRCCVCDVKCASRQLLRMHELQLHHGSGGMYDERTYLCSDCGKAFTTKAGLNQHSIVHTGIKSYRCTICSKSFAYSSYLKVHMLRHTGERPYRCTVCDKSFVQSTHLKTHMNLHAGTRPHRCTVCDKTFSLKGNLTVHQRIHTGETPYVCQVCNKGFYDSSSMRKHSKSHK